MTGGPCIQPAFSRGIATGLFVLVGRPVGMEQVEVGIGAAASDVVDWSAPGCC